MLDELFKNQDLQYRDFTSNIVPNIPKDSMIGVRSPIQRKIAKQYFSEEYLDSLPHTYYEQNCIHGFMLERIKDFNTFVYRINQFLPYIDNWAVCDSIKCTCLKKHEEEYLAYIRKWVHSKETYTIRFGISMLMKYYLNEYYKREQTDWVIHVQSDEYYVNMMRAWYIQCLFVKQRDVALEVLKNQQLDLWTHNKAIQKIRESRQVSDEDKQLVKEMRV